MQCPRLHGSMDLVILNADFHEPQIAFVCPDCRGVWMRANECRSVIGVDCEKLAKSSQDALIPIDCPHCQIPCRHSEIAFEGLPPVGVHICPQCSACFFNQGGFAFVYSRMLRSEATGMNLAENSPLDALGMTCCDCGTRITSIDSAYDVGIGCCCSHCRFTPPILSENKIQNVQLVTFHGMEIKIDHWMSSTKSRIAVTPTEPCLFDNHLYSLSPLDRFLRFGHRTLRLGGQLRKYLDATEGIEHKTPWQVFLRQQGVDYCLYELIQLGKISITFKPHAVTFEIDANRLGTEPRQHFESTIRRLLIVYERFVELSHRYQFAENEVVAPANTNDKENTTNSPSN